MPHQYITSDLHLLHERIIKYADRIEYQPANHKKAIQMSWDISWFRLYLRLPRGDKRKIHFKPRTVLENREMVVKAYKDSRRKCPFNPDLKKGNWQQLIVNPVQYVNVCWDANDYKVLKLEDIL